MAESSEMQEAKADFEEFRRKMRDPLVIGTMLEKLSQERQGTNLLLKEINAKLDRLESRVQSLEGGVAAETRSLPSETDERMLAFIGKKGRACAREVQRKFGYKGTNAASSRLNALWKQGLLRKAQAGRTVYFAVTGAGRQVHPTSPALPLEPMNPTEVLM